MQKSFAFLLLLLLCAAGVLIAAEPKLPDMPAAVSGNAVASIKGGLELYSLMGVGPKKSWDDVSNKVYILHVAGAKWSEGKSVPGVAGRVGAAAIGVRGHIYVFGGFVVDAQDNEITLPDVNAYVPEDHRWYRAADMPVPVDQAVIGVDRDRYIYIVGGRSKNGPVNNVQVYDVQKNVWSQATPLAGPPVFGHGGGLTDEAIVYVDGAMKNPAPGVPYVASQESWLGRIDRKDADKIEWSKLPAHPGPAHFGIGAGAEKGRILFSGGTATPHNFKGVAYDRKASEASTVTFAYVMHGNHWQTISEDTIDPRMDCRGILDTPAGAIILGGMAQDAAPTARATILLRK
jgi:N-acetylneuraminic acid mutarotase